MNDTLRSLQWIALTSSALALLGCGDGANDPGTPSSYTVGGTVSGLASGKSLVLSNNAGNNLTVSADGAFTFTISLANAAAYAVAVPTPPVGQTCSVSNASGNIHSANVSNVLVDCAGASANSWSNFTTTAKTLTLASSEPLKANSPFFGLEVRKNGVDITDDIVNVESLSTSSWRYTFGTQALDTPGANISVSLQNRTLATPGHYLAVGDGQAGTVQGLYQIVADCQAGTGACAGKGALPGLLAAVKGMSERYTPRDIETAPGIYNFTKVFSDAAFLTSKGMKLHVMFTVKSFAKNTLYDGTGTTVAFDIPRAANGSGGWDGVRSREVHVYVKDIAGQFKDTQAFQFNAARTQVVLNTPPPAGTKNILVVYSRDPFPEYTWQMNPPVAGWYDGAGGQNNDSAEGGGSHGFVHAPWRANTVAWMRSFMAAFETQWSAAVAKGLASNAFESISVQETANALSETDPTYTVAGYRAGLLEYAKANAKAVRRRALHGQLFNMIPQGNADKAMAGLSNDIIPWGARLEGPDLFNDEQALETNVYENVHRAFHDRAMTMIWHQNASFAEHVGTSTAFYSPAQQFIKAQRAINDTSTPSGTRGLEAEYVFWNMTLKAPMGSPQTWIDAFPVIASNPTIQAASSDRTLWRRASNGAPIGDQTLSKMNP